MSPRMFQCRRHIEGKLTLISSLTLMSGRTEPRAELAKEAGNVAPEVALVARGNNGIPYIPGSSLKGALRAWAIEHLDIDEKHVWNLFGHEAYPIEADDQVQRSDGGKVEFWDAFADDDSSVIRGATRIERASRTADHSKLRHFELVPAGARFYVRLTADNLGEVELAYLLAALQGFNGSPRIALGKAKGAGHGLADWSLHSVKTMDGSSIKAWLDEPRPRMWWHTLSEREADDSSQLEIEHLPSLPEISLRLRLIFHEPFLVSEAVRKPENSASEERATDLTESESAEQTEPQPDRHPLRDPASNVDDASRPPILPGSSVRGSLRSQAERIWRTVMPTELDDEGASGGAETDIARIFGATGRRGLLTVSDFRIAEPARYETQDFVAIDRFTGGARESAKFQIEAAINPTFEGELSLRLVGPAASPKSGKPDSSAEPRAVGLSELGLLALLLRDLSEGDLTFGFGRNKGFGGCRTEILRLRVNELALAHLCQLAGTPPRFQELPQLWTAGDAVSEPMREAARTLVAAFRNGAPP